MAELQIYDGIKIAGTLVGAAGPQQVWLWDMGPEKPVPPKRPAPPHGKEGNPEYDLAVIEFKEQLEDYEAGLRAYKQAKIDYADWQKRFGGPMERQFWSCDAKDALKYDHKALKEGRQEKPRWCLSARTRGYEKLPNLGLPEGMKPGRGHEEDVARQIAGEQEFIKALKADPVFGQEMHV